MTVGLQLILLITSIAAGLVLLVGLRRDTRIHREIRANIGARTSWTANRKTAVRWTLAVLAWVWAGTFAVAFLPDLVHHLARGLVTGIVLATLPLPIFIALVYWLDRLESEPPRLVWLAFGWGATGAVILSFGLESLANPILASVFHDRASEKFVGLVVVAPLVEEAMKALVLVWIFKRNPEDFTNVVDGVVYAVMVGLGFAMVEDCIYYADAWIRKGDDGLGAQFLMRGLLTPYAHSLYTAMTGIGLGIAAQDRRRWPKRLEPFWMRQQPKSSTPLGGFLMAVLLHGLWNCSGTLHWQGHLYVFVMVPFFVIVVLVMRDSVSHEELLLRRLLEPELRSGRLAGDEYEEACSGAARWQRAWRCFWRGPLTGGWGEWHRRRKLQILAREMAFHRSREAELNFEQYAKYLEMMRSYRGPLPPLLTHA